MLSCLKLYSCCSVLSWAGKRLKISCFYYYWLMSVVDLIIPNKYVLILSDRVSCILLECGHILPGICLWACNSVPETFVTFWKCSVIFYSLEYICEHNHLHAWKYGIFVIQFPVNKTRKGSAELPCLSF